MKMDKGSNTHSDQDSDVSFENDTDEEMEEEDWIECKQLYLKCTHTVKEQHAPDEHRKIASFNTDNEFNRAINEEVKKDYSYLCMWMT